MKRSVHCAMKTVESRTLGLSRQVMKRIAPCKTCRPASRNGMVRRKLHCSRIKRQLLRDRRGIENDGAVDGLIHGSECLLLPVGKCRFINSATRSPNTSTTSPSSHRQSNDAFVRRIDITQPLSLVDASASLPRVIRRRRPVAMVVSCAFVASHGGDFVIDLFRNHLSSEMCSVRPYVHRCGPRKSQRECTRMMCYVMFWIKRHSGVLCVVCAMRSAL